MADAAKMFERLVRSFMGDVRYLRQYPSRVQAQDGMTLDLLPDDAEMRGPGGLQGVPLRVGLPGFTVQLKLGTRVLLGYDEGNPSKPYASLFDPGSVNGIQFADGTQAVARQGDLVVCGGVGLVMTLVPLPPAVPPPTGGVLVGVPHLVSFSINPPTPLSAEPLYGSIATGRPEFTS